MIIHFLITVLVTAIALFIISKLPIGVEIDSFAKALVSALVFGILNAVAGLVKNLLTLGPLEWITWPILLLINVIVFGLAAMLVEGFRLRSWVSAVIGAVLLAVVNSLLFQLLGSVGIA